MSVSLDEVREWLQKAEKDLLSARILLGHDPPVLETACFHCQQTVEKALKAFLVSKAVHFEKVHSLTYLLDLCEVQEPGFTSLRDMAETLAPYAIVSRIMDREGSLAPFSGTVEFLRDADITFGILEGGIATRGDPLQDREHTFRLKPSVARGLANAGFDVVSLANLHIMDYGEEGFLDTLEFLSWYGVKYVGGGINIEAAREPLILSAKDVKVAFLAYYRGTQFDQSFAKENKPGPATALTPRKCQSGSYSNSYSPVANLSE
jgi:HEPN domain-containing protein